ncbi:hypothetical protein QTP88_000135 [Uroleucon formosanum]
MEFSIVENSIHISPEENQNVNNRDINSYCVINVNNLGNSELNVNETPFVSTSLVEPFIDIKPTKSPTKIYSIDEEYSDPILVKDGGRKRQKVNRKLAAKLAKHQLQTDFIISCKHNDKSSLFCKVFEISLEDIKNFKFKLCSETSKIEQDKILISYMWIIKPKRTNRRTDLSKNDRLVVKYFIPLKNEKKPVCAKAFSDITGITRRRLNILSNSFRNFHTSPKEKRGGARVTLIDKATTVSITHHIQQFKAKKSHYSRKDSDRCYLQPNLSLSKMYNLWTIEMKRTDQPIASIGKYKTIFYKHFNLSFGHPRLDVCSHCTELKAEINAININAIQKDLLTNKLSLHKEQSKHFHRIMKLENKNTINIAFDMMQNQPIPKLSVTEVFYSRQVWVYNLTFVLTTEKQIPQNCHMYTWTETESGRGPNEVGSALIHFLKMLEDKFQNKEDAPTVVNLFSDSCSVSYLGPYDTNSVTEAITSQPKPHTFYEVENDQQHTSYENITSEKQLIPKLIETSMPQKKLPKVSKTREPRKKLFENINDLTNHLLSSYMSHEAAAVVSGIPPIRLLAKERTEVFEGKGKSEARLDLIINWQREWENCTNGRWTFRLINDLPRWQSRTFGEATDSCEQCGFQPDDAEHAFFNCDAWENWRRRVCAEVDVEELTPENLTNTMLASSFNWNQISKLMSRIMTAREEAERIRQGQPT